MNNNNHNKLRGDERLLKQVEDRLERGKQSDDSLLNVLANTIPQADKTFQDDLEARLIAQLQVQLPLQPQPQSIEIKETEMYVMTSKAPVRNSSFSFLTWAAAVLLVVVLGGYGLGRYQQSQTEIPTFAAQIPTEQITHTIVIATQNIRPGETITGNMIGVITLSDADLAKLQSSQPQQIFYADPATVVGQVTTTAVFWFEPIEPIALGIVPDCSEDGVCPPVPENNSTITLPLPLITLEGQGIVAGDRVDVLAASSGGELTIMVEDVLLRDIQDDRIELAAPSWKFAILALISRTEQAYILRPNHEPALMLANDELVDYTFTSPEPLPDDYRFDLIVRVPETEGYRLVDAPYSLDNIQYSQRDTMMQFWLTDIEMVSIVDETTVTIRLPETFAANLDFLMSQDFGLTFQPDADTYH